VQRTRLQDLGIQWPASLTVTPLPLGTQLTSSGSTTGTTGSTTTTTSTPSTSSSTLSLHDLLHQNRNSLGVTVGSATANANLQDSDAKLLTNPRIRVRNHEKAKILIGERVPNITSTATSTGFVSQSINYIDIGLTLNVEPTIYLDDDVGIKVSLEVSSIISQVTTTSGTSAYEIGTRTATTVLRLKNGETDVLAGLIDNQERTSGNKLPGLGELPVLGRLFGATTDDDQKTEIVLSITPHLIRNIQRPSASDANFPAGTESSLRNRPESGATGGPTVPNTTAPATTTPVHAPSTTNPNGSGGNGLSDPNSPNSASNNGLNYTPTTGTGDVAGVSGGVSATGVATLSWQGPTQVSVGGTVSVSLMLQATQPIASVPLTIGYDNTKLRVTGIAEGPFLKQSGNATSFASQNSVSTGQVLITDRTTTASSGATAQAAVVTVTFQALAPVASTPITVQSATPLSTGGTLVQTVPPSAPFELQVVQ